MFFDATPDFFYPDFKEPGKVKLSKNLFRRIRTRDSFNAVYATSTPYTITGGETPDSIAFSKLGGSEWYWTILILNNITDTQKQWPMSNDQLDRYIEKKYGDQSDSPRHWETSEVRDANNNVVLKGGIIVDQYTNTTEQNQTNYIPKIKDPNGGTVTSTSLTSGGLGYSSGNNISTITTQGGGSGLSVNIKTGKVVNVADIKYDATYLVLNPGTTDFTTLGASSNTKFTSFTATRDGNSTDGNGTAMIESNNSPIVDVSVNNGGIGYNTNSKVRIYGGNAEVEIAAATPIMTNWYYDFVKSFASNGQPNIERINGSTNLNKVTNREYEYDLNELKKEIYLPSTSVLPIMKSELEKLLKYDTEYKITKQGYRLSETQ